MIGYRKKFIFVHIPKVAGRSLKQALAKHALTYTLIERPFHAVKARLGQNLFTVEEKGLYHGHSTVKDYTQFLGKSKYEEYFSFSFVRNPYDWNVSLYSYMQQTRKHPQHSFIKDLSFKQYIEWRIEEDPISQISMLLDENENINISHIGKIEKLDESIKKINEELKIQLKIPHINKSNRKGLSEYYTAALKEKIYTKFKEDFLYFGYEK